jgi:hypothetical protein
MENELPDFGLGSPFLVDSILIYIYFTLSVLCQHLLYLLYLGVVELGLVLLWFVVCAFLLSDRAFGSCPKNGTMEKWQARKAPLLKNVW